MASGDEGILDLDLGQNPDRRARILGFALIFMTLLTKGSTAWHAFGYLRSSLADMDQSIGLVLLLVIPPLWMLAAVLMFILKKKLGWYLLASYWFAQLFSFIRLAIDEWTTPVIASEFTFMEDTEAMQQLLLLSLALHLIPSVLVSTKLLRRVYGVSTVQLTAMIVIGIFASLIS